MQCYIERLLSTAIHKALRRSPVVAILGPRQCGKTTIAQKELNVEDSIYVDLQSRNGRATLQEPSLFFKEYQDKLICLDEVQLLPEIFSELRSEVDKNRKPGRFLLLGSASRDLIKQSSETLAGRIEYVYLTPFNYIEIQSSCSQEDHWLKGGFPNSLLTNSFEDSFVWRNNFIRTFLERDIPQLGYSIPIPVMERLWVMLAHYHGQNSNYHKLASALDISFNTLKNYLYLLEQTFMTRALYPFEANLKKRMVKSPKIYIRDSGIFHALMEVQDYEHLLKNPCIGASFEGYVIENIITRFSDWKPYYLRTSVGAEIDLLLIKGDEKIGIEIKRSSAPKLSKGFYTLYEDLKIQKGFLIAPVDIPYKIKQNITVMNLGSFLNLSL